MIVDEDAIVQVDRLEATLLAMGTANDRAFEKKAKRILKNLVKPETFEEGQRELGELLGFTAGNGESDAAPDPWWLGKPRESFLKIMQMAAPRRCSAQKKRSKLRCTPTGSRKMCWALAI